MPCTTNWKTLELVFSDVRHWDVTPLNSMFSISKMGHSWYSMEVVPTNIPAICTNIVE